MPTLSLTLVDESDAAQTVRAPRLRVVAQGNAAQALSNRAFARAAEADTALAFVYEGRPWRRLRIHKLAHLGVGHELDTPGVYVPLHVMSKTVAVAAETDSAQALTKVTGVKTFKTLVPVTESG